MSINFDEYADNETLEYVLQESVGQYPNLCRVEELGRSHEDRPIWIVTLTNAATGSDLDKPAIWIDGNLHATEVTGTMACLHTINHLLTGYGSDPVCTRLLDQTVFYIAPRLNPDGAALAFQSPPHQIRSGSRAYPYPERREGLHEEDIDGDGKILTLRIEDPSGDWKVSADDPRLMVKRDPDEYGGVFYRLLPEGTITDPEPGIIHIAPPLEGLDFNRNFPFEWAPEGDQHGAGPFPLSEPETRVAVQFLCAHPNVNSVVTCHTFGGVLLRPYSTKPDDQMVPEDLWVFQRLGRRGTALTGYPNVSTYHEFMYHPKRLTYGAFDDWCYDHLGIFAWTVEVWDIVARAGIENRKFIEWYRDHPVEDDLKILRWIDENLAGAGFVPWRPFDHPQLGPVDIGGWDDLYVWRNPPPPFLEQEVAKVTAFAVAQASASARLEVHTLTAKRLGEGNAKIELILENTGYLPTDTSHRSRERKAVKPLVVEIELPEGGSEIVQGKRRTEIGHLEGRSNKFAVGGLGDSPTDNRVRAEWVISATAGSVVGIVARSERGGVARGSVVLP